MTRNRWTPPGELPFDLGGGPPPVPPDLWAELRATVLTELRERDDTATAWAADSLALLGAAASLNLAGVPAAERDEARALWGAWGAWFDAGGDPRLGLLLTYRQLDVEGTTWHDWQAAAAALERLAGDELSKHRDAHGRLAAAVATARRALAAELWHDTPGEAGGWTPRAWMHMAADVVTASRYGTDADRRDLLDLFAGMGVPRDELEAWIEGLAEQIDEVIDHGYAHRCAALLRDHLADRLRAAGAGAVADAWLPAETARLEAVWAEIRGHAPTLHADAPPHPGRVWDSWLWRPGGVELWTPEKHAEAVPRAWVALALGLWSGELRGELEAELERDRRRPVSGLVLPFASGLAGLAGLSPRRVSVEAGRLVNSKGQPLRVGPAADLEVAAYLRHAPALANLTAQRFIRWAPRVVFEAVRERELHGLPWTDADGIVSATPDGDGIRVEVRGGWEGLARLVDGTRRKRAPAEVRELVEALQNTILHLGDDTRYQRVPLLYGFEYERGTRWNGGGRVMLRLPTWWGADRVHDLPDGDPGRKVVPILDLPALPPTLTTSHAGLAAVDLAAMAELALRADELVTRGGVVIDWRELARAAGVPAPHLEAALDLWQHDTDGAPARWTPAEGARWTLADNDDTAPAWASLRELGGRVAGGRKAGQRGAEARRRSTRKKGGA